MNRHAIAQLPIDEQSVRALPHGVIEVCRGEIVRITPTSRPKLFAIPDFYWLRNRTHSRAAGDRCWLYYNRSSRDKSYYALKHVVSTSDCSFATFRRSVQAMDEIARIKHADAVICDAVNSRISARLLQRWGWERLRIGRWHRLYIKRFYGEYPSRPAVHSTLTPIVETPLHQKSVLTSQ